LGAIARYAANNAGWACSAQEQGRADEAPKRRLKSLSFLGSFCQIGLRRVPVKSNQALCHARAWPFKEWLCPAMTKSVIQSDRKML
jgi:hypothetical protein